MNLIDARMVNSLERGGGCGGASITDDGVWDGFLPLGDSVDRVSFPYWRASFGWRAVGTRTDVLSARRIVTVYEADRSGVRVGYSIVAGRRWARRPAGCSRSEACASGLIREGSLRIVTWLRSGHTCVLAGREISTQALLRLASGKVRQAA
jgi:hypothetical protein